jgi:hypothetical protein
MNRRIWLFFATLSLVGTLALSGTLVAAQEATPDADATMATPVGEAGCAGVEEYLAVILELGVGMAAASQGLDVDNIASWSDEDYQRVIGYLDSAIARLTGLTIPEAAQRLNDYTITAIRTVQGVLVIIRESRIGAALPFADQLHLLDDALASVQTLLEEACPSAATPEAT